ncbi:MAG: hypothetical protein N4A74_26540 [Carboxylicivirga sp.]|jgi:L-alanine-DL-glutamate epimerase-like enolase superfamily enzyme|nr:hypothetical protein [Carboxylicivirga sp.]
MKRRQFLNVASITGAGLFGFSTKHIFANVGDEENQELGQHRIEKAELVDFNFHWPRLVGKNARSGVHGKYHRNTALRFTTNQGAVGWGLSSSQIRSQLPLIKGKKVSELIQPEVGMLDGLSIHLDIALHDLIGVILNKPVFEILGAKGTKETPIYSGMIYFDELEPKETPAGIEKIIENCAWDNNYGYQQLKVKIGRSGKWYAHDVGIKKDIEVVKLINKEFPKVKILVDSNDQYSFQDTIEFLQGIGDIPLLWFEEPFRESYDESKKLRKWMNENGFKDTLYADGEANPDHSLCMQLGKEGILDVYLPDIHSFGFTVWRKLMPELIAQKTLASPHAWGSQLKTHYNAHIAAAYGNVVTIEGVTCISDDIDFGNYPIKNGKIKVSEEPGFGMKLLV